MRYSILVIDDEASIRRALELVFTTKGHRVRSAADGAEGLRLIAAERPDLVITDLIMAGTEGIETIMRIRSSVPEVKVIAMSGGARINGQDILAIAREVGADACLHKPFQMGELMNLVTACMARTPTC